jgi:acyl-CoA synthetase (AMP-forming)/AMP-acid ligase II
VDVGSINDAELLHDFLQVRRFGECLCAAHIGDAEEDDDLVRVVGAPEKVRFRQARLDTLRKVSIVVLVPAVVAMPDPKWGESPCAFVELKDRSSVTEQEIIEHCRANLAHDKAPRHVVFGPLPKTSTGKIQKYVLRERVRSASAIE